MWYFPPSPARRNQECDFHFAGVCFSLCLGGVSAESGVSPVLSDTAFAEHLHVCPLHLARPECSVPPSTPGSPWAARVSLHLQQQLCYPCTQQDFPLSVPTTRCRGCLKWSWYKHHLPGESLPLEALMTLRPEGQAWGRRTLWLYSRLASLWKHFIQEGISWEGEDYKTLVMLFKGDLCKWIASWKQCSCTVSLYFLFVLVFFLKDIE